MKQTFTLTILIFILLASDSQRVSLAFELLEPENIQTIPVITGPAGRWKEEQFRDGFVYLVNTTGSDVGSAALVQMVDDALAVWGNVDTSAWSYASGGTAPNSDRGFNFDSSSIAANKRVISFGDADNDLGPGVLGLTSTVFLLRTQSATATFTDPSGRVFSVIADSDTVFNDNEPGIEFGTPSQVGSDPTLFDLQSVLIHESGHMLGLGHSSENPSESNPLLRNALMYFSLPPGAILHTLQEDDLDGLNFLYPAQQAIEDGEDVEGGDETDQHPSEDVSGDSEGNQNFTPTITQPALCAIASAVHGMAPSGRIEQFRLWRDGGFLDSIGGHLIVRAYYRLIIRILPNEPEK